MTLKNLLLRKKRHKEYAMYDPINVTNLWQQTIEQWLSIGEREVSGIVKRELLKRENVIDQGAVFSCVYICQNSHNKTEEQNESKIYI